MTVLAPLRIAGQGMTSSSVQGLIATAAGAPVRGALVRLTNRGTGTVRQVVAREDGTFRFENVPVGGGYRLEARALGLAPGSVDDLVLHVGDRVTRNFVLNEQRAQTLSDVQIRGSDLRDAGAGGPAYSIAGSAVRNLPLRDRNFVGLLAMAPLAAGGSALSVSGQHSRFNAIQIER